MSEVKIGEIYYYAGSFGYFRVKIIEIKIKNNTLKFNLVPLVGNPFRCGPTPVSPREVWRGMTFLRPLPALELLAECLDE